MSDNSLRDVRLIQHSGESVGRSLRDVRDISLVDGAVAVQIVFRLEAGGAAARAVPLRDQQQIAETDAAVSVRVGASDMRRKRYGPIEPVDGAAAAGQAGALPQDAVDGPCCVSLRVLTSDSAFTAAILP